MKYSNVTYPLVSLILVIGIVLIAGCKKDSTISTTDAVTSKLTASSWNMSSVMVDGVDKTSLYKNLTLAFTASSFSTTNGGVIWPVTGTWSFTTSDATAIKRDDGLVVTIQEATDTSLKLALTWTKSTYSTGRVESVSGAHVFTFTK